MVSPTYPSDYSWICNKQSLLIPTYVIYQNSLTANTKAGQVAYMFLHVQKLWKEAVQFVGVSKDSIPFLDLLISNKDKNLF